MEQYDLLRRAQDLAGRCVRSGKPVSTNFLTPAERYRLEQWQNNAPGIRLFFSGGHPQCERTLCFFLPTDFEPDWIELEEHIKAFSLTAAFGVPGHRDYLGSLLGMGIGREWLGDIWIMDNTAQVFCRPSIERHLLSIEKVGLYAVSVQPLNLDEIVVPERKVIEKSFSVQSQRLDAVVAGMFNLSRSEAARQISAGAVSLNYEISLKTDQTIRMGDVLSLRGKGKGVVTGFGGTTRKGRVFVYGELFT